MALKSWQEPTEPTQVLFSWVGVPITRLGLIFIAVTVHLNAKPKCTYLVSFKANQPSSSGQSPFTHTHVFLGCSETESDLGGRGRPRRRAVSHLQAVHDRAAFAAVVLLLPLVHLANELQEGALGHWCVSVHRPAQELELLHHPIPILGLESQAITGE